MSEGTAGSIYHAAVEDIALDTLAAALPGRAVRSYPALLSTESAALAWARQGAPAGAVVVADYQASPRGRAGIEWRVAPGCDLGFSVVLRPRLIADREGWLYTVALAALADVVGDGATIEWPDEIHIDGRRAAAVGVYVELEPGWVRWAVLTVLFPGARPPRAPLLARTVEALGVRANGPSSEVLSDYASRCVTLGRRVRARLIPMGPRGTVVEGRAAASLKDGALVIETDDGRRMAVRPQALGVLERVPEPES
jgi:BirA family biotin operon repressor/biotin-[acetyl-CoA-carboxylase] ligase